MPFTYKLFAFSSSLRSLYEVWCFRSRQFNMSCFLFLTNNNAKLLKGFLYGRLQALEKPFDWVAPLKVKKKKKKNHLMIMRLVVQQLDFDARVLNHSVKWLFMEESIDNYESLIKLSASMCSLQWKEFFWVFENVAAIN